MVWLIGFGVTVRETLRIEISWKTAASVKNYQNPGFSRVNLATGNSETNIPQHFLEKLNKIFQMYLNAVPKLGLIFLLSSAENTKKSYFWHFNNYNSRSKHDKWTIQWSHFSHRLFISIIYSLFVGIFQFWISRPSKFSSWGFPTFFENSVPPSLCIIFWSVKYTCTCLRWHF